MRHTRWLTSLKNSRGFSLTEALVGVGIITALALVVAKYSSETSTTSSRPVEARSCEAIAQSAIDKIKGYGVYKGIVSRNPINATRNFTNLFSSTDHITDVNLWGAANGDGVNEFRLSTAGAPPNQSRAGYALIDGYMRILAGIYNSNPATYCANWTAYGPLSFANLNLNTSLLYDADLDGRGEADPLVEIKIIPYNTTTSTPLPCPNVIRPTPPPHPNFSAYQAHAAGFTSMTPDPAVSEAWTETYGTNTYGNGTANYTANINSRNAGAARTGQLWSFPPNGDSEIGMRLMVRVRYELEGQNTACEAAQNFQYYPDETPPLNQPVVTIVQNNSVEAVDSGYIISGVSNRTVQVSVAYPSGLDGVQLFCRDRSARLTYRFFPVNATNRSVPCYTSTGAFVSGASEAAYGADTDWTGGVPLEASSTIIGPQTWVPCDQVTACGVAGNANLVGQGTPNPEYRITYNIPPANACDVIIDAIAIDPAGNRSDRTALSRNALSFSNSTTASVVRRPMCIHASRTGMTSQPYRGRRTQFGWWCNPQNTGESPSNWNAHDTHPNYAALFPNGYYTTRSDGCCYDPSIYHNYVTGSCEPG